MRPQHAALEVECEILGVPMEALLPPAGSVVALGAIVTLQHGDANLDYMLCAPIRDDEWFVHRGTFNGHSLRDDSPFDPSGLVIKDIIRDAYDPDAPPPSVKRRINAHVRGPVLRASARHPPLLGTWRLRSPI